MTPFNHKCNFQEYKRTALFLKQHYAVDEIAWIVLALAIGQPLFNRLWKPKHSER